MTAHAATPSVAPVGPPAGLQSGLQPGPHPGTRPRLRLPWTLWRQLCVELGRATLVSSCVLVAIVAFAITAKFFSDGKLGPIDTVKFMVLAAVPMLQFALPFAAGFAATMVYYRMSQDNEVLACYAGGMSRRALLIPAAITGVVLTLALTVLVQSIIPRFLLTMERMAQSQIASVIESAVDRGEGIEFGKLRLYADQVRRLPLGESSADVRMQLLGVVALVLDSAGDVRTDVAARVAIVEIFTDEEDASGRRGSVVSFSLEDATVYRDNFRGMKPANLDRVVEFIPVASTDDPKFLTYAELSALRHQPDKMNFIRQRSRDLAYHLGWREVEVQIAGDLERSGTTTLQSTSEGFRTQSTAVTIYAATIRWDQEHMRYRIIPAQGSSQVRVERVDGNEPPTKMVAKEAWLQADFGSGDINQRNMTLKLGMDDYMVTDDAGLPGARMLQYVVDGLRPRDDPVPALLESSAAQLLAKAEPRVNATPPDEFLVGPARELERRIADLHREIFSKQHERIAFAIACFVMVLAGAVLAMRLKEKLPLVVYLWSFFPAVVAVVTISAGQQMTHQAGPIGLVLLWGGVAGLLAYTIGTLTTARAQ